MLVDPVDAAAGGAPLGGDAGGGEAVVELPVVAHVGEGVPVGARLEPHA